MNDSRIRYQRVRNQRLDSSDIRRPVDVVHWLGAVQAQDFQAAKWALAQRMHNSNSTDAAIEEAFNVGKILRTHIMRPTWHFVAPDDIRWLLKLTAARVNIACGANYRKFELDEPVFKRCSRILTNALQGGKHLSRAALKNILNRSGVAANNPIRLVHILLRAELDGLICSGPKIGREFTYALLDERVPLRKPLDRDQALAKLTERYFMSHGPATVKDFMWWSGLSSADAKNGVAMIERRLAKTFWGGNVYWGPKETGDSLGPLKSAHLLAAFDEYTVAYKERQLIFDLDQMKLSATPNGLLGPIVVLNGQVVGSWARAKKKQHLNISLNLFRKLKIWEHTAIKKAAKRYGDFLGLPILWKPE